MKKEEKEFLKKFDKPFSELNCWVSMQIRGLGYENSLYCNQFFMDDKEYVGYEEIISDEYIRKSILKMIVKNFRKIIWETYFKGFTFDIKQYSDPYFSRFFDVFWQESKWEASLQVNSESDFIEILDLFECKYTLNKKENTQGLPVIEFNLIFDVDKTLSNLNKLKIKNK